MELLTLKEVGDVDDEPSGRRENVSDELGVGDRDSKDVRRAVERDGELMIQHDGPSPSLARIPRYSSSSTTHDVHSHDNDLGSVLDLLRACDIGVEAGDSLVRSFGLAGEDGALEAAGGYGERCFSRHGKVVCRKVG
jgi:hypothetical protein